MPAEPFLGSLVRYHKKQVELPADTDSTFVKLLGIHELRSSLVYKASIIELIGTALLTFTSCATVVAAVTYQFPVPSLLIAIAHIIILSFFIIATAKATGGHLNPMLSIATMVAGFTSPSRAFLYVVAQTIGAIFGAGLLRGVLDGTPVGLGGCSVGSLSGGRALLCEVIGSCIILFVAFGTALDIGQREVFGPILGPFFVSFTLAIVIFFGSGLAPGYVGPVANPSRCFGPAVVTNTYEFQWVFWIGPLIGALLMGLLYRFLPPGFNEVPEDEKPNKAEAITA